jgi:hypothetical protein
MVAGKNAGQNGANETSTLREESYKFIILD